MLIVCINVWCLSMEPEIVPVTSVLPTPGLPESMTVGELIDPFIVQRSSFGLFNFIFEGYAFKGTNFIPI